MARNNEPAITEKYHSGKNNDHPHVSHATLIAGVDELLSIACMTVQCAISTQPCVIILHRGPMILDPGPIILHPDPIILHPDPIILHPDPI